MLNFLQKLKKRWHIETNIQLLVIIIVFALTGSSSVYVSEKIKDWIEQLEVFSGFSLTAIKWIFIVTPVYVTLLVIIGTLFGQRMFFVNFAKKMLSGIGRLFGIGGKKSNDSLSSH